MFETLFECEGAEVIWADPLALSDWSKVCNVDEGQLSRDNWLEWIRCNLALLSQAHFSPNELHDPLQKGNTQISAHRPVDYGRSAVLDTPAGIFDLKGTGVLFNKTPRLAPYSTGLLLLSEALAETYTQRVIEKLIGQKRRRTVKSLAIIRLPVKIPNPNDPEGPPEPCAILVREFFPRPINSLSYKLGANVTPYLKKCVEFEMELRRNGLTTRIPAHTIQLEKEKGLAFSREELCAPGITKFLEDECRRKGIPRPVAFDPTNIQLAMDPINGFSPLLVDFSCYRSEKNFPNAVLAGYGPIDSRTVLVVPQSDVNFVRKARKRDTLTNLLEVADSTDLGDWANSISDRGKILALVCTNASRNFSSLKKITGFSENLLSLRKFETKSDQINSLIT